MKTVFLIDDDEDDREIFGEALDSLDYKVKFEQAINGLDAFEKLSTPGFDNPDIIFLDLNMPKMNGREFLLKIKQYHEFKDIPVIIYSTSSNSRDIEYTMNNKAAGFITKHHSIFELRRQLDETLKTFIG